jgi:hypothetical protein
MKRQLVTMLAALAMLTPTVAALADDAQPPRPASAPAVTQPYLSEIAPASAAGKPAWIEIVAPAGGARLAGWSLSDEDGHVFTLPTSLPTLSEGGALTVALGSGRDDLDARDGTLKLHAPGLPADTFAADGDQLALYRSAQRTPENLVDFVAWGRDPGGEAANAVRAGIWAERQFVYYDQGFGGGVAASPPVADASLGRWNGGWVAYGSASSSPGRRNPPPAPLRSNAPDGSEFAAGSLSIAWTGVEHADVSFMFELSASPDFTRPLLRTRTNDPIWRPEQPLAAGTYFWRVQTVDADGAASIFTKPQSVTSLAAESEPPQVSKTLLKPEHYRIQSKDTTMLEIGGASTNFVIDLDAEYPDPAFYWRGLTNKPGDTRNRWDGPHVVSQNDPTPSFSWNGLDNIYCVRASVAMMNAYYGGSLSEDRISYYQFEQVAPADFEGKGKPEYDLGYGTGIGGLAAQTQALSWALGADVEVEKFCPDRPDDPEWTCPWEEQPGQMTWDEIVELIDGGRPFMTTSYNNGHMRVVDGYRITHDGIRMVHLLDPVPSSATAGPAGVPRWITYHAFKDNNQRVLYLKTGETADPKQHNVAIDNDSDKDGINDFDELYRFKTMHNYKDSDYDWLNDKQELISYVFFKDGMKYDYLTPNIDQDLKRKELDWDNDGDNAPDGCEDVSGNGVTEYNLGETSPFYKPHARLCIPRMNILYPAANAKLDAGAISQPNTVMLHLDMELPESLADNNLLPTFTADAFKVKVGAQTAEIMAVQQLGDTARVLIQLPDQFAGGAYDLHVTYVNAAGAATDDVTDAFTYQALPFENAPTPTPLPKVGP